LEESGMNSWSRGIAAAALVALIAALTMATVSPAHKRLYSSPVTITLNKVPGGDTASGQVTSGKGACRVNRNVSVFEDVDPNVFGDTTEIGRTVTDATGAWTLAIQGGIKQGRTYYALVKKSRLVKNRKHKHVCKDAYSSNVVGA
jgi:hypothetical protein